MPESIDLPFKIILIIQKERSILSVILKKVLLDYSWKGWRQQPPTFALFFCSTTLGIAVGACLGKFGDDTDC